MKTIYALMIALALPLAAASTSWAQCDCGAAGGCDVGCGAAAGCGCAADAGCCGGCKVCKLVKVVKEVKAVCYGVKSKDIVIPGCGSDCACTQCITCGGKAGCCDCCSSAASCQVRIPTGKPGCANRIKTVSHLTKYITTKRICSYEWRVVDAGCCGNGCAAGPGDGCGCAAHGAGSGCAAGPTCGY